MTPGKGCWVYERVGISQVEVLRLKPDVQILSSSKSIRHTKVGILRLKLCFISKKETKLLANL